MPRVSSRARTVRRTLMMVNGQFELFEEYDPLPDRICPYCNLQFATTEDRNCHIMAKPACRSCHLGKVPTTQRKQQAARRVQEEQQYRIHQQKESPSMWSYTDYLDPHSRKSLRSKYLMGSDFLLAYLVYVVYEVCGVYTVHSDQRASMKTRCNYILAYSIYVARYLFADVAGPSNRPHPSQGGSAGVNDAEQRYNDPRRWTNNGRTCHQPFIEHFPISTAGKPISNERTYEPDLKSYIESCGSLADPRNMEAAELLMTTGLSSKARTQHLQSSFYRHWCHDYQSCACKGKGKGRVPWANDGQMLTDIDNLPHGPDWFFQDLVIGEGPYERVHTLYFRRIVDVIRDLMGNPAFRRVMRYAPERHWTSRSKKSRVYGEMWTGEWWWLRQLFLRDRHGTIAPLIIASDKTSMTKLSGNQSAYPVYLTIGNISKAYRRQASKHATVVIGYLPIDDFSNVPGKVLRTRLRGELIHRAMRTIMEPLEKAGREGVEMWCADGRLRRVYPLLAAFIGDWPEQCDMAGVVGSGCPKCLKRSAGRGDKRKAGARTRISGLEAVGHYLRTGRRGALDGLKLKPWWPWWANLPAVEFAECITPDLLHQVHKGLFKGHAMRWAQRTVGKKAIDKRFEAMTRATGLRHFKKGISGVKQWTGREAKEMMRVFVPLLAEDNTMDDELVALIRSIMDFAYIAHSTRLTEGELGELQEAHAEMHRLKHSVVDSGLYEGLERFDAIPKWHMVSHYVESIRQLGTPDGYNTEAPEYLHIVYVKRGWNASNKRDAIPQIIKYCQRLEALRIHRAYLNQYYGEPETPNAPAKTAVWMDEYDGKYNREDEEEAFDDDEVMDFDDEGEEEGARRQSTADANSVEHPAPEFAIALRPTKQVTMAKIETEYGATSLQRALTAFLRPRATSRYFILPHELFDVWHKVTLYHSALSFAPDEPLQRDVIRARPAVRDGRRRVSYHHEPAFDTALFVHDPHQFGLHRESHFIFPPPYTLIRWLTVSPGYRAGRVRAIFRLPHRLRKLYNGELVFLELFAPFSEVPAPVHSLHTTSVAPASAGTRQGIVVPIEDLALACHLAPQFRRIPRDVGLDFRTDLLNDTRHFFFNHYYNHYTFQLLCYWQHIVEAED
ncbi:hypothetical protein FRC09_006244 [Ceratobasidium sp. 395]|nr:hypothetical protein FRC09_006244 [Ceratobasidium sp. 395]